MIDPTRHRQLEELNMVELCTRIFRNARNELYLNMRYLDLSLSSLGFEADPCCRGVGTDGFVIYYHPDYVCDLYQTGARACEPGISPYGVPLPVLPSGHAREAGTGTLEPGLRYCGGIHAG